jgi:hypothetical protein
VAELKHMAANSIGENERKENLNTDREDNYKEERELK